MSPCLSLHGDQLLGFPNQHAYTGNEVKGKSTWQLSRLVLQSLPEEGNILSSLFVTLCGCWPLLLKGLKLCVLPSHTGSMFFKTIHLIWTASQRISFVLESFPEQQPHYQGVFKQMPPASASVSDNKTFSA